MLPENLATTLHTLAAYCATHTVSAWLVGGAARDLALGRIPEDLDVAVDTNGSVLARRFADIYGGAFVALKDERGAGRVVLPREAVPEKECLVLDLVQLQGPTLEADLRRRDFTINALALPLTVADQHLEAHTPALASSFQSADFIDPCGGLRDIAARALRMCSPTSLQDDPLRVLRAARLGAELRFAITPELDHAIRNHAALITAPSAERVRDELLKLLKLPEAAPWLHYLDETGVLTQLFPELEPARACEQPIIHFLPVLAHSLEAVVCAEWLLAGLEAGDRETGRPEDRETGRLDAGAGNDIASSPHRVIATSPHPSSATSRPVAVQTYPDLPRSLPYAARLGAHFAATLGSGHTRAALFKLATLLHDNAKPQTKQPKPDGGVSFYGHQQIGADIAHTLARRLRLSRQEAAYVALIVREHMRPGQLRAADEVTPRAIARFFRDTGDAGPDVLIHSLADHMATRGPYIDPDDWQHHLTWTGTLLDAQWKSPPERPRPLLNGYDLMQELDIKPGKLVGELLREIHEAQAAGEISTYAEALALARHMLPEQG